MKQGRVSQFTSATVAEREREITLITQTQGFNETVKAALINIFIY